MLGRHLVLSIAAVALAAACSDGIAPPPPAPRVPHLAQWAANNTPLFTAAGTLAPAGNPIPQVVVGSSSTANADAASVSWPHQVSADSNRLLLVGVAIRDARRTVSGVTYGATPLSFYGARNNGDDAVRVELWYLVAPPVGADSITVSLAGSARMVAGAVSFTGVDPVAPLRGFVSAGSITADTLSALTPDTGDRGAVVFTTISVDGSADSLRVPAGQTERWNATYRTYVRGSASTADAGSGSPLAWTWIAAGKWAMAAAVVEPYVAPVLPTADLQVSFWAVRGASRTVSVDYRTANDTTPQRFLEFTISDPVTVPGLGTLAVGDSVLVTMTVDPSVLSVSFEPTGLIFGAPAQLRIWYGGAGADLNGDGVVDVTDATIETRDLSVWYQEGALDPWQQIMATQGLSDRSFRADLQHFSRYAVAW